ncbi:MAG: chaperone modulator CbpM [Pseudomonadota bacterium]
MIHYPMVELSFEDLCQSANINANQMLELVEFHIVVPIIGKYPEEWLFNVTCVGVVKKAVRLHQDLALDWEIIPLLLKLIEEREQLHRENVLLKLRLQRYIENEISLY